MVMTIAFELTGQQLVTQQALCASFATRAELRPLDAYVAVMSSPYVRGAVIRFIIASVAIATQINAVTLSPWERIAVLQKQVVNLSNRYYQAIAAPANAYAQQLLQ